MKRLFYMAAEALAAAALLVGTAIRAEAATESVTLGNCKTSGMVWVPVGDCAEAGASVYYPESVMRSYAGCRITELHVYFDVPSSGGSVRLFVSHDINADPDYSETVDATTHGWHTFALEKPYTIDGGDLYIGYEAKGVSNLIYTSPFVAGEEWILDGAEGWHHYAGKYSAALYATVEGENLPRNNVHVGLTHVPRYVKRGVAGDCWLEFQNLGTSAVTSIDVAVVQDGAEKSVETIGGLHVEPRAGGEATLGSYVFDKAGESDVSLVVKAVNGAADDVPGDNQTPTVRLSCLDEFYPRNTLVEFFSTERCTACPAAHEQTNKVIEGKDNLIELCHHAGFYTDKFTIPESTEYEWFYKKYNVHAPAFMTDRTYFGDYYPAIFDDGVPIIPASGSYVAGLYAESQETPGFVTIDLKPQVDGRKLSLGVDYRQNMGVPDPDGARLYVFLSEDSIFSKSQAGAPDGFYHRNVARRSLTPAWGDAVTLPEGSMHYEAELPDEWRVERMRAVAFIANYNPQDKNDCRVYNAEAALLAGSSTGIGSLRAADAAPDSWAIYSVSGEKVASGNGETSMKAALATAQRGVYVIRKGSEKRKVVLTTRWRN